MMDVGKCHQYVIQKYHKRIAHRRRHLDYHHLRWSTKVTNIKQKLQTANNKFRLYYGFLILFILDTFRPPSLMLNNIMPPRRKSANSEPITRSSHQSKSNTRNPSIAKPTRSRIASSLPIPTNPHSSRRSSSMIPIEKDERFIQLNEKMDHNQ